MIEFLRLLFFSNILLVTPQPIELRGEVELKPLAPLVAINEGASIWIDVSSMVKRRREETALDLDLRVKELFPDGAIEAAPRANVT
jgi:hypothetical protein